MRIRWFGDWWSTRRIGGGVVGGLIGEVKRGSRGLIGESEEKRRAKFRGREKSMPTQDPGTKRRNPGRPPRFLERRVAAEFPRTIEGACLGKLEYHLGTRQGKFRGEKRQCQPKTQVPKGGTWGTLRVILSGE